jgi:hypothetical protein
LAADVGQVKLVERLLRAGSDIDLPDNRGYTPLQRAALTDQAEVIGLLIQKGANTGRVLHWATATGRKSILARLLSKGAPVDATDETGRTPLHEAATRGDLGIARFLLLYGANANARNRFGATPMHWAAWEGHIEILELLLENGAELNPRNEDGHTPLAYAQKRQHRLAAQWLQDRGATL